MTTVFVGGSRHVSRLPAQATERLNNLIRSGHHVIVGDCRPCRRSGHAPDDVTRPTGSAQPWCAAPSLGWYW